MKKLICGMLALALTICCAQADEPNADAAKVIQEIAARRAEKEAAKAKQSAEWQRGENRERSSAPQGGGFAPGAALVPNPKP